MLTLWYTCYICSFAPAREKITSKPRCKTLNLHLPYLLTIFLSFTMICSTIKTNIFFSRIVSHLTKTGYNWTVVSLDSILEINNYKDCVIRQYLRVSEICRSVKEFILEANNNHLWYTDILNNISWQWRNKWIPAETIKQYYHKWRFSCYSLIK